jgi:hypothetical protein
MPEVRRLLPRLALRLWFRTEPCTIRPGAESPGGIREIVATFNAFTAIDLIPVTAPSAGIRKRVGVHVSNERVVVVPRLGMIGGDENHDGCFLPPRNPGARGVHRGRHCSSFSRMHDQTIAAGEKQPARTSS